MSSPLAPVALFAYKRPAHLGRAVDSLSRNPLAAETALVVFCDGPRDEAAARGVEEVRALARTITGFASVEIVERDRNMGLAASITDGVGRLVREHGRTIVLEDDLVVAPRFLEFMNAALERYRDEESVMQVSGYMYPCALQADGGSGFLPSISCWGWATWERAWRHYDPSLSSWDALRADPVRLRAFNMDGAYDYATMLKRQRAGDIDSWGVIWYLSVFAKHGLVLYPAASLASNTGFDGSGTHAAGSVEDGVGSVPLWNGSEPFHFPNSVAVSGEYYDQSRRVIRGAQTHWTVRAMRKGTAWLRNVTRR